MLPCIHRSLFLRIFCDARRWFPPGECVSALLTAVCQYLAYREQKHTHSHTTGGRGWGWDHVSKEPLICRKNPTLLPPESQYHHPPLQLTHPNVSANANTRTPIHIQTIVTIVIITTHTSSFPPLHPSSGSRRRQRCMDSEAQQQRPLAGKRLRDPWAQLLEEWRCNPVLTEVPLQHGSD